MTVLLLNGVTDPIFFSILIQKRNRLILQASPQRAKRANTSQKERQRLQKFILNLGGKKKNPNLTAMEQGLPIVNRTAGLSHRKLK